MGVSVRVILQSLLVLFRYDSLLNRILMVLPCEELKPMGPLSLLQQLPKLGEAPVLRDAYFLDARDHVVRYERVLREFRPTLEWIRLPPIDSVDCALTDDVDFVAKQCVAACEISEDSDAARVLSFYDVQIKSFIESNPATNAVSVIVQFDNACHILMMDLRYTVGGDTETTHDGHTIIEASPDWYTHHLRALTTDTIELDDNNITCSIDPINPESIFGVAKIVSYPLTFE
ncbi:hypothetical protein [Heliothis virescens ascovirus 3e]|uniref:Uncharacterized protein n=2 Tax=Ascovirus hvav3a TaxID=3444724 RepID=A4KXF5_HVAVE|nr:hypothetical protein HVAV3e_gp099 [Heliothis virescens ascovirus 3e]YP_009702105.1 hypothetical protein F8204_gp112 [Heliothis virescens ascovirus 3g]ABO37286.1 hypothetical protein [Heliothis virescens ascovirus 3e]AFV50364.1 hypothetical protein [Heliothis virescens ascovirus 3g]